jgi:hypothetical protein
MYYYYYCIRIWGVSYEEDHQYYLQMLAEANPYDLQDDWNLATQNEFTDEQATMIRTRSWPSGASGKCITQKMEGLDAKIQFGLQGERIRVSQEGSLPIPVSDRAV